MWRHIAVRSHVPHQSLASFGTTKQNSFQTALSSCSNFYIIISVTSFDLILTPCIASKSIYFLFVNLGRKRIILYGNIYVLVLLYHRILISRIFYYLKSYYRWNMRNFSWKCRTWWISGALIKNFDPYSYALPWKECLWGSNNEIAGIQRTREAMPCVLHDFLMCVLVLIEKTSNKAWRCIPNFSYL